MGHATMQARQCPRLWPAGLACAGTLLLATASLETSLFARTVVAITEHGTSGTRGVVVSSPLGPYLPLQVGRLPGTGADESPTQASRGAGPAADAIVRHFYGGPVGSRGARLQHPATRV